MLSKENNIALNLGCVYSYVKMMCAPGWELEKMFKWR